jgi:hypothetical protein
MLDEEMVEQLENNILANYLVKTDWFVNKQRAIQSIIITNHAAIP